MASRNRPRFASLVTCVRLRAFRTLLGRRCEALARWADPPAGPMRGQIDPERTMRLSDFIASNLESVLAEWEEFARTHIPAGESMDVAGLRDHAADILKTVARDLRTPQTEAERGEKAQGDAEPRPGAADTAAETHGALRAEAGFTLGQMVSEFRALRASVTRLWRAAGAGRGASDFEDVTRFNEAIDQALAESLTRYARDLEHSKEMFLAILGHDVRTPLGSIMMSATGLLMRPDLAPAHQAVA